MEESILSDFISRTNTDPAFAQDLLEATGWNIEAAMAAFDGLNVTHEQHKFEDSEYILDEYDEIDMEQAPSSEHSVQPPPVKQEVVKKRSVKKRRRKGLASVAEEISDIFLRVAVSETKLQVGAVQKEKVFDEQFFKHSFLRPDFSREPEDLQKFITGDITENSHKHILEKSGRLNWWSTTGKLPSLEPLATSGDGNCLLHAASMYMWGLPDQNLVLRTHLHRLLTQSIEKDAIHRRWKYSTELHNQDAGGLTFSDEEWEFEWHEIIRIATNKPRRRPTTDSLKRYSTLRTHYESLEEIHVFGLAHVLRRPVIVIADEFLRNMEGEPLAPIYFGGIYLPIEINPSSCFKSPLILAYDSSHFSPLVAKKDPFIAERHKNSRFRHMQSKQDTVMPLVTPDGSLLPLLFSYDPKRPNFPEKWSQTKCPPGDFPDEIRTLLESYMDIRWIQLGIGSKFGCHNEVSEEGRVTIPVMIPKVRFPAAVVSNIGEPEYQSQLVEKYLESVKERFEEDKIKQEKLAADKARQIEEMRRIEAARPKPCRGEGCTLYGTANTDYYCSQCYTKSKSNTSSSPTVYNRSVSVPLPSTTRQPHPATPPELITRPSFNEWDIINSDTVDSPNIETPSNNIMPSQGRRGFPSPSTSTKPPLPKDPPSRPIPPNKLTTDSTIINDSVPINRPTTDTSPTTNVPPSRPTPPHNSPVIDTSSETTSSDVPPKIPPKMSKQYSPSKTIPTNTSPVKTTPPARPAPPSVPQKTSNQQLSKGHLKPLPARGYSRDNIKPISFDSSSVTKCLTPDCTFHGSRDGYCSQCYRKNHPSVTQL